MGMNYFRNAISLEILDTILKLRAFSQEDLPSCKFISIPTLPTGHSAASLSVSNFGKPITYLNIDNVDDNNVNSNHWKPKDYTQIHYKAFFQKNHRVHELYCAQYFAWLKITSKRPLKEPSMSPVR